MYWANKDINLPVEPEDIIHWWGYSSDLKEIADKVNDIVLSNYDNLYLDTGTGRFFWFIDRKFVRKLILKVCHLEINVLQICALC